MYCRSHRANPVQPENQKQAIKRATTRSFIAARQGFDDERPCLTARLSHTHRLLVFRCPPDQKTSNKKLQPLPLCFLPADKLDTC